MGMAWAYSHAREPLAFSGGNVLPHTIRSSLVFPIMVPTSFLADVFQQGYPNYSLQRLIPPQLRLTSAPISVVSVGLQLQASLCNCPVHLKASHCSSSPATAQTLSSLLDPSVIVLFFPGG